MSFHGAGSAGDTESRSYYPAIVLALVYCFASADRQIFSLLVNSMVRDFGLSDMEISYLLGPAFIFSYVGMGLPAGWCADRFNRSRLILVAGIIWGVGTASAVLATDYAGLFISRLIVGASEAFLYPAAMSLLPDMYAKKRLPIATSIFMLALPLGNAVALLGGGFLLEHMDKLGTMTLPLIGTIEGWQLTLVAMGGIGLLPVAMMVTIADRRQRATAKVGSSPSMPSFGFVQGSAYILTHWKFYLVFFTGMACQYIAMTSISAWAPTYLARTFELTHAEIAGRYGSIVLIFGIAGSIASPMISTVLSRRTAFPTMQTVRMAPILLVAFSILLAYAKTETFVLVSLALLTFAYSLPMSMGSTSLQLATPDRLRGLAAAYFFIIVSLVGYGIGPTAVPLVSTYVFNDAARIGEAIAVISIVFGSLAILLFSLAIPAFGRECAERSDKG